MFEVSGDDIKLLNDTDLRTLIGLLCEADLRRVGLPVSAVTWGGNQTAKDGGLDVRVALPPEAKIEGFIPRPATGFQVKKPDMRPASINKEMKPDGAVRPVINELALASGALCVPKTRSERIDDEVRPRWRAKLWRRIAEPDERPAHPFPKTDVF